MKIILCSSLLCLAVVLKMRAEPNLAATSNTVRITSAFFNELVEEMRLRHPALRAGEARARAAQLNTNAVRTWEDPMFTFGGVAASQRGPRLDEEGDLIYGLEQSLPLFGKAQASRRVAHAEAETESARFSYQFELLRRDLAKALFKVALADQTLKIGAQDLAWLETMVVTGEERYRAGTATQVDLLRIQNEQAKRADQFRTEGRLREQERLAVNRLLGRDLHTAMPELELPPLAGPVHYNPRLVDYAVKFEPKLRMMQREIKQAEASVVATRKSRLPGVSAGIEGRQYSGDGGFREGVFTVSLNVPWFNGGKYRSDLERDRARLKAVELDVADYQLAVRQDVHRLTVGIDAARRQALLYRDDILPRSRQALESAHANWLANRGMFNDVMEARRMLFEAQLMVARAVSEQYQLMSELVLCCGLADLESLELLGAQTDAVSPPTSNP